MTAGISATAAGQYTSVQRWMDIPWYGGTAAFITQFKPGSCRWWASSTVRLIDLESRSVMIPGGVEHHVHTEILPRRALTSRIASEISPERPRDQPFSSARSVVAFIARKWRASARAWRLPRRWTVSAWIRVMKGSYSRMYLTAEGCGGEVAHEAGLE